MGPRNLRAASLCRAHPTVESPGWPRLSTGELVGPGSALTQPSPGLARRGRLRALEGSRPRMFKLKACPERAPSPCP